ncbi:PREDICTED: heparan sulfate 2-O-sulfotransferase pipe-like, partial [Rhagoletis zephyria]|uniref:heparan sulfate 2-O-sulfotransferase pipe-like n=1 Tax=Rhagoletis zephyria TaxID=28612 RepID=UPI0008115CCD
MTFWKHLFDNREAIFDGGSLNTNNLKAWKLNRTNNLAELEHKMFLALTEGEVTQVSTDTSCSLVCTIFDLRASELNNTVKAEADILVFNRVPKTGSIQMIELMKQLGSVHNYEVVVDPQNAGVRPILSENDEEDLIKNITQLEDRAVFASHVNYLDFKKYGKPRPIYVNLVRDPIERVISWHYYIRLP